jgi:hypothetical protein
MKKIIMTASLAALGAVSLQAAYAPGLSETERSKPWSVAATLRGFYDDNYTTSPEHPSATYQGAAARSSYGMEISPSASLNLPLDQTLISLSYQYGMRYYEDREKDTADHSHQFNAKLSHAFTENYKLDLSDSFVIAQEPEVVDPNTAIPMRLNGNNMRNTAAAKFSADITRLFGVQLGYSNTLYDYDNDQYSALLNRMEHLITFDTRWHLLPKTVGILGYQYGMINYDDKKTIGGNQLGLNQALIESKIRDNRSHYAYVGVDQTINSKLSASARLGGQFTEYQNAKSLSGGVLDDSSTIPYADANVTYAYATGSYAQLGIKHTRMATDVLALDQEATTVYGSVNHQITAKLMGSVMGQVQNASFNQGPFNNSEDNYFVVGLNLTYTINQYLAAEAGYNFDRLDSDIQDRSFTRNRVYLGLRASY